MKMRNVLPALALCALALGGCDLFFEQEPPPRLVIKNESLGFDDISKIEFWEETPEARKAGWDMTLAFIVIWTNPTNPWHVASQTVKCAEAVVKYTEAVSEIVKNPPLIIYDTVIPPGESCVLDSLNPAKSYVARVNDKRLSSVKLNDKGDIVYVFNDNDNPMKKQEE
jgi:hypothetical protein